MFNHFLFFMGKYYGEGRIALIDESNAIFIDLLKEREKITHKKNPKRQTK
jgi:hypothetical protein